MGSQVRTLTTKDTKYHEGKTFRKAKLFLLEIVPSCYFVPFVVSDVPTSVKSLRVLSGILLNLSGDGLWTLRSDYHCRLRRNLSFHQHLGENIAIHVAASCNESDAFSAQ
jgi:hypothetical protein